jgi:hypothetical protein
LLDSRVIGFLHGDCACSDRELSAADAEALGTFSLAFCLVYERSVLRTLLRVQRQEIRQVAAWADARAGKLADRLVSLQEQSEPAPNASSASASAQDGKFALRGLLTRRELEVLELIVRGESQRRDRAQSGPRDRHCQGEPSDPDPTPLEMRLTPVTSCASSCSPRLCRR